MVAKVGNWRFPDPNYCDRFLCMMRYQIALLILVCFTLTGCPDKGGGVKTYPAGGVVKLKDGQPLAGATVSFLSPQNDVARAVTDAEGKFQLGTFEETDGAVAGKHRVAVLPQIVRGSTSGGVEVHSRFTTAETSGIEVEVTPDGENQFQIEVERASR
jgi:hypothetical protein